MAKDLKELCVPLLLASLTQSLPASADDYLNMALEQLLQVPVTGSTLRDESLKTVPAAVSIFTHEQIDAMGIDYLYELLNLVPGYQFDRGGDNAVNYTFSARGRRNSSLAREVLVLMDGRLLANPRSGAADGTFPLIPLEQIERVEVMRGPGSALYGSSAFNGVINIITRRGKDRLRVELGSENRRSTSLTLEHAMGGWVTNIFARAYEDDGQTYQISDVFSKQPVTTNDPRTSFDIDAGITHYETQLRAAYHRTSSYNFYNIEKNLDGFDASRQTLIQLSLDQGFHWFDNIATQLYIGYLQSSQDLHVPVLGAGGAFAISQPASTAPVLTIGKLDGENINVRLTNDWTISENASGIFGVEWKREREVRALGYNNYNLSQLVLHQFPVEYYGDFTRATPLGSHQSFEAAGIYGEYLRNLSEDTRLTLGVRYDRYDHFGSHVSPRVGLVHQLTETQTLKLLYGEAYRAPSIGETGVANNPLVVGNPDLHYEVVKTWDLIWMATWKDTSVSLGGFRNNYTHPIVAGFIGNARTYVNSADEHSDGMEMELQQHLTQHWTLGASYTDFISMPATTFREAKQLASAQINFNQGAWNWNLLSYHQGPRKSLGLNNSQNILDGFWVVNSKLRYSFEQGYNVSLQFKNLADLEYTTPAQGANIPDGVPNRRREISVILDWAF